MTQEKKPKKGKIFQKGKENKKQESSNNKFNRKKLAKYPSK